MGRAGGPGATKISRRAANRAAFQQTPATMAERKEAMLQRTLPNAVTSLARAAGRMVPAAAAAAVLAVCGATIALADPAKQVTLELNKLEAQDKSCRAYLVVSNDGTTVYQSFKLDLVMFQPDGVIGKRFALDLAPIKAGKKTVKLFDLDGVACDKVGSFLVNDIMECKSDGAAAEDCLSRLTLSSLGQVKISK